ncbi:MAG: hypothetical protein ACREXP_00045 [Steroidobacteraceae bacterium]
MSGGDWLTLPGEEQPQVEKNPDSHGFESVVAQQMIAERAAAEAIIEDVKQNLPTIAIPMDGASPPVDAGKRAAMLDTAWKKLNKKQRVYLTVLRENKFNQRATDRLLRLTTDFVSRTTVRNWINENEDFVFVLKVMKTVAAGASIDRERLILRAEEIADEALDPTPILYQGAPTGFYENHKDTALRANEQLMKIGGHLRSDEKSTRVTVRVVNLAGPQDDAIDVEAEVIE